MRVLCIGECMAELAPQAEPDSYRLGFAGDTYNTAWYLRRLRPRLAVSYCTALGHDPLSERLLAEMASAGIDTGAVRRVPDASLGLYLISLSDGERSFSYWRDTSAARRLADDPSALRQAMAEADVIYTSGITLAILGEAGRAALLAALAAARAAGRIVAFDPNLRPRLWPDAASMTSAVMEGAARADIALPSFEDEAAHFGDADPNATAQRYAAAGVGTVIVKNGAGQILVRDGGTRLTVTPPRIARIVDTTAAGDSFNAGFLAGRIDGWPVRDCVVLAARVAARTIQGKGALVPLDPAEVGA